MKILHLKRTNKIVIKQYEMLALSLIIVKMFHQIKLQ